MRTAWTFRFNETEPTRNDIELANVVIEHEQPDGNYYVRFIDGKHAVVGPRALFVREGEAIFHLKQWLEEQMIHFTPSPSRCPTIDVRCGTCRSFVLGNYHLYSYCRKKKDRDVDLYTAACNEWKSSPGETSCAVRHFEEKIKEMEKRNERLQNLSDAAAETPHD